MSNTLQDSINAEIANGIKIEYLTKKQKEKLAQATFNDIFHPIPHGKAAIMNRLKEKHAKKYA
jgi:hypothetical protein